MMYLILINLNLNLNSPTQLVVPVLDSEKQSALGW